MGLRSSFRRDQGNDHALVLKGLKFPIVAVVGLADGRMPWTNAYDSEARDETSKLRRTFFVACSRAMRRLLVVADPEKPSPFVEKFDSAHWNVA